MGTYHPAAAAVEQGNLLLPPPTPGPTCRWRDQPFRKGSALCRLMINAGGVSRINFQHQLLITPSPSHNASFQPRLLFDEGGQNFGKVWIDSCPKGCVDRVVGTDSSERPRHIEPYCISLHLSNMKSARLPFFVEGIPSAKPSARRAGLALVRRDCSRYQETGARRQVLRNGGQVERAGAASDQTERKKEADDAGMRWKEG